jgi:hypothetical protein
LPSPREARSLGDSDSCRTWLGRTDAEKVYTLVAAQVREENVPPAQLALTWVSAHMPRTAEDVLATARAHYSASAA